LTNNYDCDVYIVIDGRLRGAAVDAYLEVAPAAASAQVTGVAFGVADRPDGEPLVSTNAKVARADGAGHWTAGARLNLSVLPPGDYVVTATVLANERAVKGERPVRQSAPRGAGSMLNAVARIRCRR
jgi:hypothetical protein